MKKKVKIKVLEQMPVTYKIIPKPNPENNLKAGRLLYTAKT